MSADSDFVFNVRRQAFREYVELDAGWNDARERERHLERFGRQRFRVIVVGESDVGYIATTLHSLATATYLPGRPEMLHFVDGDRFVSRQSRYNICLAARVSP